MIYVALFWGFILGFVTCAALLWWVLRSESMHTLPQSDLTGSLHDRVR